MKAMRAFLKQHAACFAANGLFVAAVIAVLNMPPRWFGTQPNEPFSGLVLIGVCLWLLLGWYVLYGVLTYCLLRRVWMPHGITYSVLTACLLAATVVSGEWELLPAAVLLPFAPAGLGLAAAVVTAVLRQVIRVWKAD